MGVKQKIAEWLGITVYESGMSPAPVAGSDSLSRFAASVYFKYAALDTALSYIANAVSKCEFKVFEGKEQKKGALHYRLNYAPNPNENAVRLWYRAVYRLLYNGDALIVPLKDSLYLAESWSRDPKPLRHDVFESVVVENERLRKRFRSDQAIYLRHGNPRVSAMVQGLYEDYGRLMTAAEQGFERSAGDKYKLKLARPEMGRFQEEQQSREQYDGTQGMVKQFMRNANAVYIETEGQSLEQFKATGTAAKDVIDIRKDMFETVAGLLKVPAPLLFGNMTNLGDIMDIFLTFAIDPLAELISTELTSKFFTEYEWLGGSEVKVDTSTIKHVDIFDVSASISQLIGSGFSLNEIREPLGWPLLDIDEADEHLITRNFGSLDEVLRQMATGGEK